MNSKLNNYKINNKINKFMKKVFMNNNSINKMFKKRKKRINNYLGSECIPFYKKNM